MRRRYRLLLVPPIAVALLVLGYLMFISALPLVRWQTGVSELRFAPWRGPDGGAAMFLLVASAYVALYRALAYHPFWHGPYQRWLQATPWTPEEPPPLQPLRLVLADVLPLAVLVLLSQRHPELHPAHPLMVFGFTYLLITAATLGIGGARFSAVTLLAGLPLVLLPGVRDWGAVAVLAALYPVALAGTRRVLGAMSCKAADFVARLNSHATAKESATGWPFKQLAPSDPPKAMSLSASLLLSVLAGWWAYAVCSRMDPPELPHAEFLSNVGLTVALPLAAARALRYLIGYAPPIGVLGRLALGRLIIPGYDKIFVAPACILLAGLELPRLLLLTPLGLIPSGAILLAVLMFLATAIGPTVANWQLTGTHRLLRLKPGQQAPAPPTDANAATA